MCFSFFHLFSCLYTAWWLIRQYAQSNDNPLPHWLEADFPFPHLEVMGNFLCFDSLNKLIRIRWGNKSKKNGVLMILNYPLFERRYSSILNPNTLHITFLMTFIAQRVHKTNLSWFPKKGSNIGLLWINRWCVSLDDFFYFVKITGNIRDLDSNLHMSTNIN